MNTRGVGLLLVLSLVIALGTLAQDYRLDGMVAHERAAGAALTLALRDLDDAVAALPAAQRAYVVSGQGPSEWAGRVSKMIEEASAAIAKRQSAARDPETVSSYVGATEALARFKKIDGQIRSALLEQNDRLHATDLIFMDSATTLQRVTDAVAAARTRELAAIDGTIASLGRVRLGMNGVAMLFVVGVALYFGRAVTKFGVKGAPSMAQMLRDLPPPVRSGAGVAAAGAGALAPAQLPPVMRPANLAAAAELCVDLGRVLESGEVPILLDRAASVLDARGIVLWAIDSAGARLHPSICHGYSDRIVKKLRPLQIDADNVTSLAFRSNQPQAMNGATATDAAAIAIPLMTGTGCVGVLAAELRHNRPPADLIPVARIIGAQLSTLMGMPADNGQRIAQA